jgi:predicted helicase
VREDGVKNALNTIAWQELTPDSKHTWLVAENAAAWDEMLSIGSKAAKASVAEPETVFRTYSAGVKTNRDSAVYNFNANSLANFMRKFINSYNSEINRYKQAGSAVAVDNFVDENLIKWDGSLKVSLTKHEYGVYSDSHIRNALYRPYTKKHLYFDKLVINSVYLFNYLFPNPATEQENRVIAVNSLGAEKPFYSHISAHIVDLNFVGGGAPSQCFPLYTYAADGTRRDNITDWALAEFRRRSGLADLSKADIFHYVYAALHHPQWRSDFAQNLKKELPRIPWPDASIPVARWVAIGRQLAELHLHYEQGPRANLEWIESAQPVHFRVSKMKRAGDRIIVNETLTLAGIPAVAWSYKLGNRSALEWLIDQYQVSGDSDPNAYSADPMYIVALIERVTHVSVATMELVGQL